RERVDGDADRRRRAPERAPLADERAIERHRAPEMRIVRGAVWRRGDRRDQNDDQADEMSDPPTTDGLLHRVHSEEAQPDDEARVQVHPYDVRRHPPEDPIAPSVAVALEAREEHRDEAEREEQAADRGEA